MKRPTLYEAKRARYRKRQSKAHQRDAKTDPARIDMLLEQSYDRDPVVRRHAAGQLCPCHLRSHYANVWDRIFCLVEDPERDVRMTVVHMLCDGSPRELEDRVVDALERLYHDPDRKLRRQVRQVLARYRRRGQLNVL